VQVRDAATQSVDLRPQTFVVGADVGHLLAHSALSIESLLATSASGTAVLGPPVDVVDWRRSI